MIQILKQLFSNVLYTMNRHIVLKTFDLEKLNERSPLLFFQAMEYEKKMFDKISFLIDLSCLKENSFLASGEVCCLLTCSVSPDLGPNLQKLSALVIRKS